MWLNCIVYYIFNGTSLSNPHTYIRLLCTRVYVCLLVCLFVWLLVATNRKTLLLIIFSAFIMFLNIYVYFGSVESDSDGYCQSAPWTWKSPEWRWCMHGNLCMVWYLNYRRQINFAADYSQTVCMKLLQLRAIHNYALKIQLPWLKQTVTNPAVIHSSTSSLRLIPQSWSISLVVYLVYMPIVSPIDLFFPYMYFIASNS